MTMTQIRIDLVGAEVLTGLDIEIDGQSAGRVSGPITEVPVDPGIHIIKIGRWAHQTLPMRLYVPNGRAVTVRAQRCEPEVLSAVTGGWYRLKEVAEPVPG